MRQIFFIATDVSGNQYDWSSSFRMIGQFFYIILAFAAVVLLAYFATKWLARAKLGVRKKTANIHFIESYAVNMQSSLQILRIGRKYILVGVTKDKFSYITELDAEDIKHETEQAPVLPFENILKKYAKKPEIDLIIKKNDEEDADD